MKKNLNKIFLMMILVLVTLTSCKANEEAGNEKLDNSEYLQGLTEVELDHTLSVKEINQVFLDIFGEEAGIIDGKYSSDKLVEAVVENAGLKELSSSYTKEDSENILKNFDLKNIKSENMGNIAVVLEQNIIAKEVVKDLFDKKVEEAGIDNLYPEILGDIINGIFNNNGLGRNYIGTTLDDDIGAKLNNKWESFILFENKELQDIGNKAVKDGIVTGYNLKNSENNSNFISDKTIVYGHSSIKHAQQLLGLLKSKEFEAKIQLEPKISVFKYLLEWGPVPEPTPTYEVKKDGDDYFAHAVEYDLIMEFKNIEDMEKFNSLIEKYAKKNEGNEEGKGLLVDSWWQPLYSTVNAGLVGEEYLEIKDCVLKNDIYEIHTFTTVEDSSKVLEELKKGNEFETVENTKYCNKAFYNYLIGEDYQ